MHEVSLMQNLFALIADYSREYRLTRITRIVLRVGSMTGAAPDALRFAFTALSPGTAAADADFVIEQVAARSQCTSCGQEFPSDLTTHFCPACGKPAIYIAGQELHLQTLEGDQEDNVYGN